MSAVFVVTFPSWLRAVDHHLLAQTGRVLGDLPIPDYVAWEWYARGWRAREVADRLVDRAVKVRKTTICREYGDNPRRDYENSNL